MKAGILITLAVCVLALAALLYHHYHRSPSRGPVVHVRNEFQFTVHAPYRVAAPLFGPEKERGWAEEGWDPQFLYPHPAQDVQGAVFTIRHGHRHAYWINTSMDIDARHFQYVYLIPEAMVVLIDVRFSEPAPGNTIVKVSYERTALNPEANEHVRELGNSDRESGKEWDTAINGYLAKQEAGR